LLREKAAMGAINPKRWGKLSKLVNGVDGLNGGGRVHPKVGNCTKSNHAGRQSGGVSTGTAYGFRALQPSQSNKFSMS